MKKLLAIASLGAALALIAFTGGPVARAEGPNAVITSDGCQAVNLPANDDG